MNLNKKQKAELLEQYKKAKRDLNFSLLKVIINCILFGITLYFFIKFVILCWRWL